MPTTATPCIASYYANFEWANTGGGVSAPEASFLRFQIDRTGIVWDTYEVEVFGQGIPPAGSCGQGACSAPGEDANGGALSMGAVGVFLLGAVFRRRVRR
jgi:MYXO-CTERM domain-containing protein